MVGKTRKSPSIISEIDVPFTTSDGTILVSNIYRPQTNQRLPVLLMRKPYNKDTAQAYCYAHPAWYARQGYVVVVQDSRGRYKSGGDFYPFHHEALDGYESIGWASRLPYCDGQVATYGFSFPGMNQLLAASLQPPALKTAIPAFTGSDQYMDWNYAGGAFSLAFNTAWATDLASETAHKIEKDDLAMQLVQAYNEYPGRCWRLPLSEVNAPLDFPSVAPYYFDWLNHPVRDDFWKLDSVQENYDRIKVPLLHLGGWYDMFLEGTLRNYTNLRSRCEGSDVRKCQRLIIGPWYHMPWTRLVGCVDFGEEAGNLLDDYQLDWLDFWLKGNESEYMERPPVRLFTIGENRWQEVEDWPPPGVTMTTFHLHSQGRANSRSGNGWLSLHPPDDEDPDNYIYYPYNPVPSIGGHSTAFASASYMGPQDQRPVEDRTDVLVYSTEILQEPIEVTGQVVAVIFASSSAQDTDFTAKLVDVFPDGRAINLCDGILRARFHAGFDKPSLIKPGEVYEYKIAVGSTSNLFQKGHRIRVEISSSNFPVYDRNPNTGKWSKDTGPFDMVAASQMVLHDPEHPSHIILPIRRR